MCKATNKQIKPKNLSRTLVRKNVNDCDNNNDNDNKEEKEEEVEMTRNMSAEEPEGRAGNHKSKMFAQNE